MREDGDDGTVDAGRASGGRGVPFATEPQVKAIYAIARGSLALEPDEIELRSRERFGALPQALNRRQASAFIDALKAEAGAAS